MSHTHIPALSSMNGTKAYMPGRMEKIKGVLGLVAGILAILLFMFGLAPALEKIPYVKPLVQFIEEREIDASALYYTEIEEFAEAELNLSTTMTYPPGASTGDR